jgi:bifunctional non-homologous end joining protein LigD
MPGFIEPALATLQGVPPAEAGWVHEIKYDGYRTQAHLRGRKAQLFTRRGYDWSETFSAIADALTKLRAKDAIIDGEIIVRDAHGVPDFAALQSEIARRRSDRLTYVAFDLLWLDGKDLRRRPLVERKAALLALLAGQVEPIVYSDHLESNGDAMFRQACEMRLEGIISKRADEPYRSGRTEAWIKIKCTKRDAFPIIAFVEKLGAKPRRIASLYLGRWEGKRLLYAGKARSGYTNEDLHEIRERLDPLITNRCPLSVPIDKPKATWIRPEVEAEVTFASVTTEGLLREPVFKRLVDEPAGEPPDAPSRASVKDEHTGAVPRANILQLLPDAVVPSREQLEAYWRRVAKRALPYLAERPLKLVRHDRGITFYHKGPLPPLPSSVHVLKVQKREGGEGSRVWVDDLAGLLGLVEIGAVELHPWNATLDDIEHPDQMVFDLDPGEGIAWQFVVDTALALRGLLEADDLPSWPKLSGGKGIHLMVPIERSMTHDGTHAYARSIAEKLTATDRTRYTVSAAAGRKGKLFIDYLRNGRGTTAVGTYSPRARPGLPIAAPTTWRQVEHGIRPDAYGIDQLPH